MKEKPTFEKEGELEEKYGFEGQGKPPEELKGKAIVYIDEKGEERWILRPEYIAPSNKEGREKAEEILKEMSLWPYH